MIVTWARLDMKAQPEMIEAIHLTREDLPITINGVGGQATEVVHVNVTPYQIALGFAKGTAVIHTRSTTAVTVRDH